jgi:hypothetical protein
MCSPGEFHTSLLVLQSMASACVRLQSPQTAQRGAKGTILIMFSWLLLEVQGIKPHRLQVCGISSTKLGSPKLLSYSD